MNDTPSVTLLQAIVSKREKKKRKMSTTEVGRGEGSGKKNKWDKYTEAFFKCKFYIICKSKAFLNDVFVLLDAIVTVVNL